MIRILSSADKHVVSKGVGGKAWQADASCKERAGMPLRSIHGS